MFVDISTYSYLPTNEVTTVVTTPLAITQNEATRVTATVELMQDQTIRGNLITRAIAKLSVQDPSWLAEKCNITAITKQPTHGVLNLKNNGDYEYTATKLGKDVIIYSIESANGRKAVITHQYSVIPAEGSLSPTVASEPRVAWIKSGQH